MKKIVKLVVGLMLCGAFCGGCIDDHFEETYTITDSSVVKYNSYTPFLSTAIFWDICEIRSGDTIWYETRPSFYTIAEKSVPDDFFNGNLRRPMVIKVKINRREYSLMPSYVFFKAQERVDFLVRRYFEIKDSIAHYDAEALK